MNIIIPRKVSFTVRQEGTHVILLLDGRKVCDDIPWESALQMAKAIYVQAKKAEELAKVDRIIDNQAILLRAGAPFGLSNNKDIQKEAVKESLFNRLLRRYIPFHKGLKGIESRGIVGTPTFIQH